MEIWGKPEDDHLLINSCSQTSDAYLQWSSYVDIAAFVPIVFSGAPTTYLNGNPILGASLSYSDERLGALCKDSSTVVFVHFSAASRPSEVYWYILSDTNPGWQVTQGTHGDLSTWHFMTENSDPSAPYNYVGLYLGPGCSFPGEWY